MCISNKSNIYQNIINDIKMSFLLKIKETTKSMNPVLWEVVHPLSQDLTTGMTTCGGRRLEIIKKYTEL